MAVLGLSRERSDNSVGALWLTTFLPQFGGSFSTAGFKLPELQLDQLEPVLKLVLAVYGESDLPRMRAMIAEVQSMTPSASRNPAVLADTRARLYFVTADRGLRFRRTPSRSRFAPHRGLRLRAGDRGMESGTRSA